MSISYHNNYHHHNCQLSIVNIKAQNSIYLVHLSSQTKNTCFLPPQAPHPCKHYQATQRMNW